MVKKGEQGVNKFEKNKRIKKNVVFFFSTIVWFISAFLLLFSLSHLYQQLFNKEKHLGFFGFGDGVVVSESMVPVLNVNDLIFYKQVDGDELQLGDIIIYKKVENNLDKLIVHQIISIDDNVLVTKGVNNEFPDAPIITSDVVGKYLFKIDNAGYFSSTIFGPIILILIFVVMTIIEVVLNKLRKQKTLQKISQENDTRKAIDYFFDI